MCNCDEGTSHDIDIVLNECHILDGRDKNGNAVYAAAWMKPGTYDPEDKTHETPGIITGLGMIEAAKFDLLQRFGLCNDHRQ